MYEGETCIHSVSRVCRDCAEPVISYRRSRMASIIHAKLPILGARETWCRLRIVDDSKIATRPEEVTCEECKRREVARG